MFAVASYTVENVFTAMEARGKATLPDGRTFRRNSERLILFKAKGTACVTCGIEGTVFILETHDLNVKPHLNLYAVNEDGKHILMTKDHIQPKSRGGANALDNYNTMCAPCNTHKADKVN